MGESICFWESTRATNKLATTTRRTRMGKSLKMIIYKNMGKRVRNIAVDKVLQLKILTETKETEMNAKMLIGKRRKCQFGWSISV